MACKLAKLTERERKSNGYERHRFNNQGGNQSRVLEKNDVKWSELN